MANVAFEDNAALRNHSPRIDRPAHRLRSAIEREGLIRTLARGAEVYGEHQRAEYVYKVMSGTVRAYKMTLDGHRVIGAFYLPGDIFGIEAGDGHLFSTEAVVAAKVLVMRRDAFMRLAAENGELSHELWALTARELEHTQKHMLLLSKSAAGRVAGFLLEMSQRADLTNDLALAMSRQDIGDYLGLSSETVSRILTRFEHAAAIILLSCRRVVLRNRGVLVRLLN